MTKRLTTTALLTLTIVFSLLAHTHAAKAATPEHAARLQTLNQKIDAYENQIAEQKNTITDLESYIDLLDTTIQNTEAQIERAQLQIAENTASIQRTTENITSAKHDIRTKNTQLKLLMQELYTADQTTILELVFSQHSLSDILSHIEYTNDIQQKMHTLLDETQSLKKQLEQHRNDLQSQQAELQKYTAELEANNIVLREKKSDKESLLEKAHESSDALTRLLQEAQAEQRAVEERITLSPQDHPKLLSDDVVPIIWPIDSRIITCVFHCSNYNYPWQHNGLDIATVHGTPVHAAASGYVSRTVFDGTPHLAWIRIEHTHTFASEYLHMSEILVVPGQYVNQGDVIGYSGGTKGSIGSGASGGPHLHLTIFHNNVAVDPLVYLP